MKREKRRSSKDWLQKPSRNDQRSECTLPAVTLACSFYTYVRPLYALHAPRSACADITHRTFVIVFPLWSICIPSVIDDMPCSHCCHDALPPPR